MGQEGSHPLLIIPFLLFFLTTLYVLYQLRRPLLNHARVRWPVLAYLLLLVLSHAVLHFGLFSRMEGTSLFDPVIYASSWMATSLIDLLVRSLLLLLFVLALSQQTLGNRKALLITAHVMLALLVWFTVLMINSLVMNSAIAFDIRELFLLIAIHLLRLFVLPPPVWPLHYLRQSCCRCAPETANGGGYFLLQCSLSCCYKG